MLVAADETVEPEVDDEDEDNSEGQLKRRSSGISVKVLSKSHNTLNFFLK